MNQRLALLAALSLSGTLPLHPENSRACDAGSSTITNLPAIPGSGYQVFSLNAAGDLAGFFYVFGEHPSHAFQYSGGQLTDLGTLGGSTSEAHWINQSGQVVGKAALAGDTQSHAFLLAGGGLQDLGTLGGPSSSATAINDSGTIIGVSDLPGGAGTSGFVISNGTRFDVGNLGRNYSAPFALNNAGLVVGEAGVPGDVHAFTWSNGIMSDLGTFGGTYSSAFAVNDSGMVVGEASLNASEIHAFISTGGAKTDLGTFGGTYSGAYMVNSNGLVAGLANTSNDLETHGFIYDGVNMTDLGTLGGSYTQPNAINNRGQVVGESFTASDDEHAFLWQKGKLTDLNSLLPDNSGWELVTALYINDAGRVVGVGNYNGLSQWFVLDLATGNNPPVAVAGPDQTVDCQSSVTLDGSGSSDPDNDTLSFEWSTAGNVLGTSSSLTVSLPMGTNVVTLKVTDPCGGSSQANLTVIVADRTPPAGSCPTGMTVSADVNCQGTVPDFTSQVKATDNCTPSGSLIITQNPPAGTIVGLGQHPVTVTVADASGNTSTCMVLFTVADATPPTILSLPPAFTLSAVDGCQATVPDIRSKVVAADACTPADLLVTTQSPEAGTSVGLGDQMVVVTVSDPAGNSTRANVPFKVADMTAPVFLSHPGSVKLCADAHCQASVPDLLSAVLVSDNCSSADQIALTQSPAAGAVLAHGFYAVTLTAVDASGNRSQVSVPLEIDDITPPVFQSATVSPNTLSPPNHQLVPVTVSVKVADNCDACPLTRIVSITCNQPVDREDIQITGRLTARLAASKGQSGMTRVYTINLQSTDASGNSSTSSVTVTVPGKDPVSSTAAKPKGDPRRR
ncbi:MAG TPA: HYR domain-containing protein [Verrucomicrobiae bacterium]|nr:HYR domain-containing protein [Verrucomicrobiae bacterium]